MIPVLFEFSNATRDLLVRRIELLFPASGVAGLYMRRTRHTHRTYCRLEIRCARSLQSFTVADFASDKLFIQALPFAIATMKRLRPKQQQQQQQQRKKAA